MIPESLSRASKKGKRLFITQRAREAAAQKPRIVVPFVAAHHGCRKHARQPGFGHAELNGQNGSDVEWLLDRQADAVAREIVNVRRIREQAWPEHDSYGVRPGTGKALRAASVGAASELATPWLRFPTTKFHVFSRRERAYHPKLMSRVSSGQFGPASEFGMTDDVIFQGKPLSEWLSVLEKGDTAQRQQAIEVWKRIGKTLRDAVPRLLDVLKGEDEALRLHAMGILGDLGQHAHTMALALRAALHSIAARDTNNEVRQCAAEALSQIGPQTKTPVPALIDSLRDDLSVVRQGAAHALGELGPDAKSASAALIASLHDQDLSVRLQAAWALWKIDRRDRVAVPVLIKVLQEGDEFQRWMAADCLGDMGECAADALPALNEARVKPTRAALIRKGIELAIERIGSGSK